jgi:hypothetical protein
MNEKGANIDLLFRNGLKDFEVLPPPGVWDGVHSVIKSKSQSYLFLKVAAAVTVLLTLSFFTYRWASEISDGNTGSEIALSIPASKPLIARAFAEPQLVPETNLSPVDNSSGSETVTEDPGMVSQAGEMTASIDPVYNFQEIKSLSVSGNLSLTGTEIPGRLFGKILNPSQGSSEKIKYPDIQYYPDDISTKLKNRWSIAAMASPTYFSSFTSGGDGFAKQMTESEQPLVSYSGGLALSYKISKRFTIQSGLYYSSLGQKLDGINSFDGFQSYSNTKGSHNFEVLTTAGTIYTSNPNVFLSGNGADSRILTAYTNNVFDPGKASLQPVNNSLDQNLSFLELPVVLRYKLVDKTIGINLIGGLSYNLLVHNSVYTTLDGNKYPIGDTKGINPLTLSSSLGMGMEYNFSDKLSLNLEPTFRYYLNPFSVNTGSSIHPYSFGIFSGVSYKF